MVACCRRLRKGHYPSAGPFQILILQTFRGEAGQGCARRRACFTDGGVCDRVPGSSAVGVTGMHLAWMDRGWGRAVFPRGRLFVLALMCAATAPAHAVTVTGIGATASCDAVTGMTSSGASGCGQRSPTGSGAPIAWVGVGGTIRIPFERPDQQRDDGRRPAATVPPSAPPLSAFAPQCAPPSLSVSQGEFDARIMKGGLAWRRSSGLLHPGQCWRQRGLPRGNALLPERQHPSSPWARCRHSGRARQAL